MNAFFDICCGSGEEQFHTNGFSVIDDGNFLQVEQALTKSTPPQREKAAMALDLKRNNRRPSVFSSPLDTACEWSPPIFQKTPQEEEFLCTIMSDNILFRELCNEEMKILIDATEKLNLEKGARAVRQHSKGEYLFIVEEGCLEMHCEISKVCHGTVQKGQIFGELALLWGKECDTSAIATEPTIVWRLEQSIFRNVVARHAQQQDADIVSNLQKVELFQQLPDSVLRKVAENLTRVHYGVGETIVRKGEIGETFYIIESGSVRIHDIGIGDSQSSEIVLHNGDSFGERSLLTGESRTASVTALSEVVTLAMDRSTFEENIGVLQELVEMQARKQSLRGLPIFANSDLNDAEFDRLAQSMQDLSYRKGTKLAKIGEPYPKNVWFLRTGQVIVFGTKSGKIYNLLSDDYFGEKSILSEPGHISSHEAICEDNVNAWVISRNDIESVVVKMDRLGEVGDFMKSKQQKNVIQGLADLKKHRILGRGGFGRVWLVESRVSGQALALKVINKRKLLASKQERSVLREKELLGLLHHPFILNMVSSFQDISNLYLVLPVIQGGELFSVVATKTKYGHGLLNNDAAFYAAGIIAALGHFHHRLIAYRDMKLENVMIDIEGYPKIVDLGFARIIVDKSFTFCGTPDYLAPEIIMSKGHNHSVDYWSFGVLVYEMLVGHSPFSKPNQSQMDMFKRIVMVQYECPPLVSSVGKDLIRQLLVRPVQERIGTRSRGHLDIMDHDWFKESCVSFQKLLKREMIAPWTPKVKDPFDASNFDNFASAESEVDIGRPLTTIEQDIFKEF